ncbi:hypothetical protein [uncultured Kordia sp.]|uniref:hypothetical protein n=1 Tax=uncultured Kordia sp. TaxID=507699 RepID=UPI00263267ED|nr:hypothetical protein [uncultured Kordia sp.]
MSSYNDNLHSSVVSSLNAQELELQKVKAKQDASMFSLYYAQGARITASEKLEVTSEKYEYEQKVNGQATVDSDISTNVLASANNAKTYTDKSVTNTSVAASNMQIATNAIVKLSSDTGSILSIVSAGDFGTEIYDQAKNAAILMDNTAYVAEVASQKSMESSASISEVSTKTLVDKATVTDTSVKDLLAVVSGELEATNTLVQTETSEVATTSTEEKKAEGQLEDLSVSYRATRDAYKLSNSQLNLDLTVLPSIAHQKFTASFNIYKNPFHLEANTTDDKSTATKSPVDSYYVMLVKESQRQTFTINNAETIVNNGSTLSYVKIDPSDARNGRISQTIYISQPKGTELGEVKVLHDSDGNEFKLGDDYVIFVLTVFTTEYKKSINTFDDYLSAASMMFTMKHTLNRPSFDSISVAPINSAPQKLEFDILQKLEFDFEFNKPAKTKINVGYRCIFLPDNCELIDGLLTAADLQHIEKGIEFDEEIANYNYEIHDLQQQNDYLKGKKSNDSGAKDVDTKGIDAKIAHNKAEITKLEIKLKEAEKQRKANDEYKAKPGFFFNTTIAEQIPAGSYTDGNVAAISFSEYFLKKYPILSKESKDGDAKKLESTIKKFIKDFIGGKSILVLCVDFVKILKEIIKAEKKLETLLKNEALMSDFVLVLAGYTPFTVSMEFAAETTDNFGNRLIGSNSYIPAVLVVSDTTETQEKMFKNTLSNFGKTNPFTYIAANQSNTYEAANELVNSQPQKCKK